MSWRHLPVPRLLKLRTTHKADPSRVQTSWPSLRRFWASSESVKGEFPSDLPDKSNLVEVVALNARRERFEELLSSYHNVTFDVA